MNGYLGIDFGTSNTVIALWNPDTSEAIPLKISEYSSMVPGIHGEVPVIPSLIHYAEDQRIWIGQQVLLRGIADSPHTFRWMKRYISHRSPMRIRIHDREITPYQAGADFLKTVLLSIINEYEPRGEEVGLSVPVESFEHYENWLASIAENAGINRFRLIDEPSAAALGYGAHIQPGNIYLIFDFGGGTFHASVVLIEDEHGAHHGRRCRVLGKAGRDIGGATIDQWLFQDILKRHNLDDWNDEIRQVSTILLNKCQVLKETLSIDNAARLELTSPELSISASYTREQFENLLENQDLFTEINRTVREALNKALERGFSEDNLQAVLLVGGSCQIPCVQRVFRQLFGKDRVFYHHPLDAVARGTAAFAAGVDFYDHIQHDYAIRYLNTRAGKYEFRVIVPKGTPYPTKTPVSRLTIKATHPGQKYLGIAIFEMSDMKTRSSSNFELVFDMDGSARIANLTPFELEQRSSFWMNQQNPTFLVADPPAEPGEPCFEVEFNIDSNKRLVISARDLRTGQMILKDALVVRLS